MQIKDNKPNSNMTLNSANKNLQIILKVLITMVDYNLVMWNQSGFAPWKCVNPIMFVYKYSI